MNPALLLLCGGARILDAVDKGVALISLATIESS
jgi:hypothetical protein